jgi:hypothetical protein
MLDVSFNFEMEGCMGFLDKLQETLDQGLKSSKELFGKAKEKAKDLGELGVLRFEIRQLESQAEKLIAKLGSRAYEVLTEEDGQSVSGETEGVKEILGAIAEVRNETEAKEKQIEDIE